MPIQNQKFCNRTEESGILKTNLQAKILKGELKLIV